MLAYTPQQAVVNTLMRFVVDSGADRVQLKNDSPYYLAVYIGSTPPASPTTSGWNDVISPGDHPVLPVVNSPYGQPSHATQWFGDVWCLPFEPPGYMVPHTGTIGVTAQIGVTTYRPGEQAPSASAIAPYVNLASEARIVSLPISTLFLSGIISGATAGTAANVFNVGVGPDGACTLHLYGYLFASANSTGVTADTLVEFRWFDAANNLLQAVGAARFLVQSNQNVIYTPSFPITGSTPTGQPTMSYGSFSVIIAALWGGTTTDIYYGLQIDGDQNNMTGIPPLGGGYLGGTASGIMAPQVGTW